MKIKVGGGGVDKDGNWYDEPERIIDVPDDWFQRQFDAAVKSDPPSEIVMSAYMAKAWRKIMKGS